MFKDFKSDGFMFAVAIVIIAFVIGQSLFFLIRAAKRGKEIGLTKETIKSTITSSAVFSVAPAVGIGVTVLALSLALGYVLPWIRLSVIGSITYEVPAAEAAIEAAGLSGGIGTEVTDPGIFTAVAWVMTLGSVMPLILIPLLIKKIQTKITGAVNKNAAWADIMSAAAFIGLIAAFLGKGIAGTGDAEVAADGAGILSITAIISSIVFMLILVVINKKLKWKWLDALAMPISMVAAIFVVFLVAKYFPSAALIEWRT